MRIAFVSTETVHHRDTEANQRLERVARLLSTRGHDVTVYTTAWWDEYDVVREIDGVQYNAVAGSPSAKRSFMFTVPFEIQREGADVIHAAPRPPGQVRSANLASSMVRAPLIVDWYGHRPTNPGTPHRRALDAADRVMVPSRLVKTQVRELGVGQESIDVVPNGIDMELVRTAAPAEDAGQIVYARRLDEGANLESLLLGLAELRTRDWSATVIGEGPEREGYEAQARDLRIDDRIDFVGQCDRQRVVELYKGAHVFAQTATRSVFPTELLWALASGCVGIVEYHANSSAHELVEGRTRGFRITDPEELANAIQEAGDLENLTVDEDFSVYDDGQVVETYLDRYLALQEATGIV
ncbi:MAG: glycosyltransferase involved in cell wall biosynthesis [Halobacteriales archaeon]|jgi:glycosyltransferase involved in cell wall biosynthesis